MTFFWMTELYKHSLRQLTTKLSGSVEKEDKDRVPQPLRTKSCL